MRGFFKEHAYSIRNSNILFVCGGNEETDKRPMFREYAKEALPEYKVFFPEFSFKNLFSLEGAGPQYIELSTFEEAVAGLSCCVILFPEAPGSLVELGLFSGNNAIVENLLVVVDKEHDDGKDSFISLGPVNGINKNSKYRHVLFESYEDNTSFDKIKNRLEERHKVSRRHTKVDFGEKKWRNLTNFEKMSVIHWIVEMCRIADVATIQFIAKSMFGNTVSNREIVDFLSVLISSDELSFFGEEKWVRVSPFFNPIITTKSGDEEILSDIKVQISDLYLEDGAFSTLLNNAFT